MKKTAIAIAVALAGFATVAQAAPKDNTWYAGGKLGWSQFHDTGWYNSSLNNDGPTHELSLIHISEPTRPHSVSRMPSSA